MSKDIEVTQTTEQLPQSKGQSELLADCEQGLRRLFTGGYALEEKATLDASGKVIKREIVKKLVQPNLDAIIYYQTNIAPDKWSARPVSQRDIKKAEAVKVEIIKKWEAHEDDSDISDIE